MPTERRHILADALFSHEDELVELRTQRDELLTAVKVLLPLATARLEDMGDQPDTDPAIYAARRAIVRCKE